MKKLILFVGLCSSVFMPGCGCTTVEPGNVGIKVPLFGGGKDSYKNYELVRGRVLFNSWTENVYIFPTYMQQIAWTKETTENDQEDRGDESITFNSSEGAIVNCDVFLAFQVDEDNVKETFALLRRNINDITHGYLRSEVRDAFVITASTMKVSELMGTGKSDLLKKVKDILVTKLEPRFKIDTVSIIGKMRVDDRVSSAISATIEAQQRAIEAENKVKQVEAEARQAAALAKGTSDAEIAVAVGRAQAKLTVAKAEAEANKLLEASLSDKVLQNQALKVWDGKLPSVMNGNAVPFINVSPKQ